MANDPANEKRNTAGDEQVRVRRLTSEGLFRGEKLVIIDHAGEEYRLTLTRNNRLILQK